MEGDWKQPFDPAKMAEADAEEKKPLNTMPNDGDDDEDQDPDVKAAEEMGL